jgi:hypothetical protein
MNILPFHVNEHALRSHPGVARCSATAQELWLTVLEECYCSSTLQGREVLKRLASRKGFDQNDLLRPLGELIERKVCAIDPAGRIRPVRAEYLNPDFWMKIDQGE